MEPLNASDISRRNVLRIAAGLGLTFALPPLDLRAASRRGGERPKSLMTLWLAGGPSQLETWDPHPGTSIGGEVGLVKTRLPSLEIADLYPRVAEQIDVLTVIRSLVSKEGDHERGTYLLKTGYRPDPTLIHPAIGAIVAHELPVAGVEIPRHVSIVETQWPPRGGFLGDEFDAFKILDPNQNLQNIASRAQGDRQQRRLNNLEVIEQSFRRPRPALSSDTQQDTVKRALAMMNSEQLKAFHADDEPVAVRQAYGETAFGRGCLVARRLIETGVRAVEINLNGWDTHARNHEGHKSNAAILDPAFAALLHDLRERDLLASTVVLCIGEFGRTPHINPLGGRDHWPTGFSAVVGGGGLRGGQVIGKTDPQGEKTLPEDPLEIADLYATILHTLGVDYHKELNTPIGRPMRLCAGQPIARLLDSPVS